MIFIIIKWYVNKPKFLLIQELLNARGVRNKIRFNEEKDTSALIIDCHPERYNEICEEVIDPLFNGGEGGEYYSIGNKIDITKPISVIDVRKFPVFHYAKLLPNYLKEKEESIAILENGRTIGFIKFDPDNIRHDDFIVSNILHCRCEQMSRFHSDKMKANECIHNQITRYSDGFHCDDCDQFFHKETAIYRRTHLLVSIWMVLNNINVDHFRLTGNNIKEVLDMRDEIGIGEDHPNYQELISKAELIMKKYGKDSDSASISLEG